MSTWETLMYMREGERRVRALQESFAQSYLEFIASPAVRELMRHVFEEFIPVDIDTWENEGGRYE